MDCCDCFEIKAPMLMFHESVPDAYDKTLARLNKNMDMFCENLAGILQPILEWDVLEIIRSRIIRLFQKCKKKDQEQARSLKISFMVCECILSQKQATMSTLMCTDFPIHIVMFDTEMRVSEVRAIQDMQTLRAWLLESWDLQDYVMQEPDTEEDPRVTKFRKQILKMWFSGKNELTETRVQSVFEEIPVEKIIDMFLYLWYIQQPVGKLLFVYRMKHKKLTK